MSEPVADPVAEHRTRDRGRARGPRIERLQPDEYAANECNGAAGHDRADQRDGFEERRYENGRERDLRMRGEIRDQRLQVKVRFQSRISGIASRASGQNG